MNVCSDAVPTFPYGLVEIAHLKDRDPLLGTVIERLGRIDRAVQPDLWTALVQSLVSQQISKAAATTVWGRLQRRLGDLTPSCILQATRSDLQACGLPAQKAERLQRLSALVMQGDLDLSALPLLPEVAVLATLSALPGVGVWTAEMLLIFALGRPDVVSWGDQAIRRGMQRLYGVETLNKAQFMSYRERYRPYGTVASFYLWALAEEATSLGSKPE